MGDLSYVEEEWAEKVRVSVGEGGKWTVLRHCRGRWRERGLSVDNSGWDWEECLRMGRGNATLIGDIGEGTWETLAEGGEHGGRESR